MGQSVSFCWTVKSPVRRLAFAVVDLFAIFQGGAHIGTDTFHVPGQGGNVLLAVSPGGVYIFGSRPQHQDLPHTLDQIS